MADNQLIPASFKHVDGHIITGNIRKISSDTYAFDADDKVMSFTMQSVDIAGNLIWKCIGNYQGQQIRESYMEALAHYVAIAELPVLDNYPLTKN